MLALLLLQLLSPQKSALRAACVGAKASASVVGQRACFAYSCAKIKILSVNFPKAELNPEWPPDKPAREIEREKVICRKAF